MLFSEKRVKMFNFGLLFLRGFAFKRREIWHKAVVLSRIWELFFLKKGEKTGGEFKKKLSGDKFPKTFFFPI